MENIKDISMAPEHLQEASEPSAVDRECHKPSKSRPEEQEQLPSTLYTDTPLLEGPAPPSAPHRDGPKLPKEEEEEMFRALQAIFQTAEEEEEEENFDVKGLLNALGEANEDARLGQRNMNILKGVRDNLGLLWRSGSDYMVQAAEVLANGSRDRMFLNYFIYGLLWAMENFGLIQF